MHICQLSTIWDVQLKYLHDQQLISDKQRLFFYSTVSISGSHQSFISLMTLKFENQKSSIQHVLNDFQEILALQTNEYYIKG